MRILHELFGKKKFAPPELFRPLSPDNILFYPYYGKMCYNER